MNVREWVVEMGGIKAVAAAFGLRYNAVHNWCMYNRIPAAYHLQVFRMSAAKGLAFDPERPSQVRENKTLPLENNSHI
jgi:hypothetical protein